MLLFSYGNRYRKALRMMYYADHHGLPIITFIDTPGAFADLKSEELGQVCLIVYLKNLCLKVVEYLQILHYVFTWCWLRLKFVFLQGEAIAFNLRTMFGLKVPIVTIVIGEGGSGGALAIGCANKLLMLENAVFYVARWFDQ